MSILDPNEVLEAAEEDENTGFCILCGAEAEGVEPDAQCYICEMCGEKSVFGAQELVVMGYADE